MDRTGRRNPAIEKKFISSSSFLQKVQDQGSMVQWLDYCAYPNFNPSSTSQQLFCLWVSLGFSAREGNILPAGQFIAASAECLYFQLRLTHATSEALFGKKKSFPCRISPDGGHACLLCHSCSRNLSLPFSSCYSGLVFRKLVSVVGLKLERVLAEFVVVFCGFIWPG